MKISADLILTLKDPKNGTILSRTLESKSYIRAFILFIFNHLSNASNWATDTSGVGTALYNNSPCSAIAGAAVTTHGMVAGSGNTPVALSDYRLATLIANGAGAGQLSYASSLVESYSEIPAEFRFYTRRSLVNNSGGNVTVNEVGLYVYQVSGGKYFAFIRDVITAIVVAAGQTLTIEYKIKILL